MLLPRTPPYHCGRRSQSEHAHWLRQVKNTVVRAIIQRQIASGEPLDKSCSPLYLVHVMAMNEVFSKEGSADSAMKKCAIGTVWRTYARSSEPSHVTLDNLEWCDHFQLLEGAIAMSKSSKFKLVGIGAGAHRHCCGITDLADYFATMTFPTYDADLPAYVFPTLVSGGATKVGNFIKSTLPEERGGSSLFRALSCDLPQAPSAGGLRPGVINMLLSKMPAEFVLHASGHDATQALAPLITGHDLQISPLWEWVDGPPPEMPALEDEMPALEDADWSDF